MLKLLPHKFKIAGAIMAPTGFTFWLLMQKDVFTRLLHSFSDSTIHVINVSIAVVSLYSFLFGMYALTFSKEKVEDEMTQKIRLESFQFSALVQIAYLIIGIITMGWMKNPPGDVGLLLFFIIAISVFWLAYIFRFNYVLKIGIYRNEK